MKALMFDATDRRDPGERDNLLGRSISTAFVSALDKLLSLYENASLTAELDVHVRQGLAPDTHVLEPMNASESYLC